MVHLLSYTLDVYHAFDSVGESGELSVEDGTKLRSLSANAFQLFDGNSWNSPTCIPVSTGRIFSRFSAIFLVCLMINDYLCR